MGRSWSRPTASPEARESWSPTPVSDAQRWVDVCLESGDSVLIEDFLDGPEVSVFAVCTERGAVPLEPARDYKRLLDGDRGPNTGGMGAYSPVNDLPAGLVADTMRGVIEPVLAQMAEEGTPFRGFLYAGLVLTSNGPKVLEFNVRLGDPETQAVLPRLETDLIDVLEGAAPVWSDTATVNVVLAAEGYPDSPVRGSPIQGLGSFAEDVLVFHAGTRNEGKTDRSWTVAGCSASSGLAPPSRRPRPGLHRSRSSQLARNAIPDRHRSRSVVGVTEHQGDPGWRRCHLGDGVLPVALTGAAHHHQVAAS